MEIEVGQILYVTFPPHGASDKMLVLNMNDKYIYGVIPSGQYEGEKCWTHRDCVKSIIEEYSIINWELVKKYEYLWK